MPCANCGFDNPPGFGFCGRCGATLEAAPPPPAALCPRCGTALIPGFAFCGKCGLSLAAPHADRLTGDDLDHLRRYLARPLMEEAELEQQAPPPRLLEQCLAELSRLIGSTQSHLPAYLVERVTRDPVPGRVDGQFVTGTLLFADISGFTAMSERLSRAGKEGAEEITDIVNRYFEKMLALLRAAGGQLIKFGGDALLGLFPEPPDDSAARAVSAALRMQAAMAEFAETRTSQGAFPLQMKVSVRRGRFFAAQLGGEQNMEHALFGAEVSATAAQASAAEAGQVLVNQAVLTAIPCPCISRPAGQAGLFIIESLEAEIAPPPRSAAPTRPADEPLLARLRRALKVLEALTPYLPTGLLARLTGSGAFALEGEHRLVAALFAHVEGLGELADALGPGRETEIVAALNRYFVAMQSAIQQYGGVINKIDLYEHGDKLMALFGAPVAHEDDAERAVRAALAMQAALTQERPALPRLRQHIGLSYGFVYAGYVGAAWQREYTVMGDQVNLAARLMTTAADGQTVAGDDVRRKVKALFDFRPTGEVKLKGKSAPVPVYLIEGPRAIPEPLRGLEGIRSPLVGREAEWAQMRSALEQALAGRGQVVRLTGEAGLGKSRLVSELRQHFFEHNPAAETRWVEGRCLSYTESVSYYPFLEVVRRLVGVRPDDGAAEAWAKVRAALDEALPPDERLNILPYLANFIGLPLDDDLREKVRYLDAEALQRRTFVALRAWLEAYIRAYPLPLVLVLDDIHWMDQASLKLLDYVLPLVDRLPLLLILMYRLEREAPCWRVHERLMRDFAHCTVDVALHGLTSADSQQLLRHLIPLDEWPEAMLTLVLSRTEGNPLYVEEVLRVLMDEGALIRNGAGQWRANGGALDHVKVPDTLQGVLMTRLDRLDEPARHTAQAGAVVGRTIPFDLLNHLLAEARAGLASQLVRLQQQEIVQETQRVPELAYGFRHVLMRDVCYDSLLARLRRQYHTAIAEYLERNRAEASSDTENTIALIAHHALAGQDWPRALHYQILAGQQAQRLFAHHEAVEHFTQALRCADNLPPEQTLVEQGAIHAALGELFTTTGQHEAAHEHLLRARELGQTRGEVDAQAHACRWLAYMDERRGHYPTALEFVQHGLVLLGDQETVDAAHLHLVSGLVHSRQGNHEQAFAEGRRALSMAERLGELTVLARTRLLLGHLHRLRSEYAEAVRELQEAHDLYQRAGDIHGQAMASNTLGLVFMATGQLAEAERQLRQARDVFQQVGDVYYRAFADNNLGEVLLKRGDLDGALTFYQSALQAQESLGGSAFVLGALNNNLGSAYIRRGDAASARRRLRVAEDYFQQSGARDFLPEMRRHLARAALIAGEVAEAETQAQQALALARELKMRSEEGSAQRVLGEIAMEQSQWAAAENPLLESVAILEEVADEYELARSRFSLARVYGALNRISEGRSVLERAIATFERLGAAMDLAAARALLESWAKK